MVKAMDYGIDVGEFVPQSGYYVHFRANTLGKVMNPLMLPACPLRCLYVSFINSFNFIASSNNKAKDI